MATHEITGPRAEPSFSWRRTAALGTTVALHAVAFLLIISPVAPPVVAAQVRTQDLRVIDLAEEPPPPPPVPVLPEPPQRPPVLPRQLRQAPIQPVAIEVPAVSEEASPVALEPPVAEISGPSTDIVEVAPNVHLGARLQDPPAYPRKAVLRRQEGRVVLLILVGTDGSAKEVRVHRSSGHVLLDRAASEAARRWTFTPGTRDGRPAELWAQVPVDFNLRDF